MPTIKSLGAEIGIETFLPEQNALNIPPSPAEPKMIAVACNVIESLKLIGESQPVTVMDMRGQIIRGSRVASEAASSFTIANYNADFESVRESMNVDKVHLFAYSPGGFFAVHYALKFPERVASLILVEPAIYTDKDDLTQRALLAEDGDGIGAMEAMLSYIDPKIDKEVRRQMADDIVKDWQSPAVIARVFRLHGEELIRDNQLRPLRKIPTLLIGGEQSAMNFHIKRIAAAVPEASVWWIRGADHISIMSEQYAKPIADVVKLFIGGL